MEELGRILKRTSVQKSTSANTDISPSDDLSDGDKCPVCKGHGWVVHDVPVGHPDFGKTFSCECALKDLASERTSRLERYSNLGPLVRLTFDNFHPEGLNNDADFRGNSGCLIHVGEKNALGVWPRSIEVQGMNRQLGLILPIPRNVKCTRTFEAETSAKVRKPLGEFSQVEIEVKGGDMVITLNGAVVSTVGDCELTEGPSGFQSEGAETHWRNIRIREE